MLDENDARQWLKETRPYPLTIFTQRYGCTKHFVAMAMEFDDINPDAVGGDMEAIDYWRELDEDIKNHNTPPYGEGNTIEEAIASLRQRLQEYIDWWDNLREQQANDPECQERARRLDEFLKGITPLKAAAAVRDTIDLSTGEGKVKRKED